MAQPAPDRSAICCAPGPRRQWPLLRLTRSQRPRGAVARSPVAVGSGLNDSRQTTARIATLFVAALTFLAIGCKPLQTANADHLYGQAESIAKAGLTNEKLGPVEGQDEFDIAKSLFNEAAAIQQTAVGLEKIDKAKARQEHSRAQAKYAEAQAAFKKIRKKYRDKPIEQDAMFYIGECYYEQGYLPAAQDQYDELIGTKYSNTRYIEPIARRLFYIAQKWLNSPKPASEIERVEFTGEAQDRPVEKDPQTPYIATLVPNFTDRTRPLFDPEGRALQALKSIWLHDPTGPLADDALLLSATYHMRRRNFKEADGLFDILRSEYPQSDHAQNAYLLGSHIKLMTYQGSSYDGKQLEEAEKLIDSTIRLYPELPERDKLKQKLDSTKEAAAARKWDRVQFYLRKGARESAALYCEFLLRDHPNSEYAVRAVEMLKKLRPQPKVAKRPAESSASDAEPLEEVEFEPGTASVEDAGEASDEEPAP